MAKVEKSDIAEEIEQEDERRTYRWEGDPGYVVVGPDGFSEKSHKIDAFIRRLNLQHEAIEILRRENERLKGDILEKNDRLESWETAAEEMAEANTRLHASLENFIVELGKNRRENTEVDDTPDDRKQDGDCSGDCSDECMQAECVVTKSFLRLFGYLDPKVLK
jgi:hypothetical protein